MTEEEHKKTHTHKKKAKESEEVSIDFSKITGIFKGKKKAKKEAKEETAEETKEVQEEVSLKDIDWRKALTFFQKYGWVLLLLIPMIIGLVFRMYPATLPITDQWATDSVHNYMKSQIEQQIVQQYPNLPAQNRQALIDSEFKKALDAQKDQIAQQIQYTSQQFKEQFRDDKGVPFWGDIDSYYWLRFAENYVDHGYTGDEMRDGQQWDNHMLAPIGTPTSNNFHTVVSAYLYKIVHVFNPDATVMGVMFYIPILFSILAIIPCFFIVRKVAGNWGAFFASFVLAVMPQFLSRTAGGIADTDAYNVFFPLLIMWLFLEAITAKQERNKYILGALSGFAVGVYSLVWHWWFVFDFILVAVGVFLIYLTILNRQQINKKQITHFWKEKVRVFAYTILIFMSSSLIFIGLFLRNLENVIAFIKQPFLFLSLNVAASPTLWPNVLTTVAELNDATIGQIISSLGGKLLFVIAIIGIIYLLLKKEEDRSKAFFSILVAVWFIGTMFMALKGMRFILLMIPAFSVAFGIGTGGIILLASDWLAKNLKVHKIVTSAVFVVIFLLVVGFSPLPPFCTHGLCAAGKSTAMNEIPMYNDAWHNALTKIKQNSQPTAIINSWWDFGHWFKWGADRAVTFDGASQGGELAHLIGYSLMTSNEEETVGILKLVDCGGLNVTDTITSITKNVHHTADIVHTIVTMDKDQAKEYLLGRGFSEADAEKTVSITHCAPPEDFFITSEDMVGKSGVWGHFGSWNFERAQIWNTLRFKPIEEAVTFMVKEFNYTDEQARNEYYEAQSMTDDSQANAWISPWPSYVSSGSCTLKEENKTLLCRNGLGNQVLEFEVDLENKTAVISNSRDRQYPRSLVYVEDGDLQEKVFEDNYFPYSLCIIPENGGYTSLVADPLLAKSMFTRLFYYQGIGSKYFELFDYQRSITGGKIYVWKVNWEGKAAENQESGTD
ncbi:MAG: glycosyltransferase family 39 protein [Nanoarchaeota archaeon]|nr:glycosyltransferase family 39 protein [Nanoarchaeota archaeon]